jgi:hypothetical protein
MHQTYAGTEKSVKSGDIVAEVHAEDDAVKATPAPKL